MSTCHRRSFLCSGILGVGVGVPSSLGWANSTWKQPLAPPPSVNFLSDGLPLTVAEQAALLATLAQDGKLQRDVYLNGGAVAELEKRFAHELGKEKALFLPTGTLANHLAIRQLARGKSRVIVQAESHIYRDSSDCVQQLSQLNLIPLAREQATIPLSEIELACRRSEEGPFPVPVGAISLECPVRRRDGEVFDFEEMKRIAAFAHQKQIKMHLDGARLFLACGYTGIPPKDYAALFDTVYVSLYKCFNAGTGAVLAGPAEIMERVAHDRKLFGAGLYQAWPYAAVALHFLDGYLARLNAAIKVARELMDLIAKDSRIAIEHAKNGTNIYKLRVQGIDAGQYQRNLAKRGYRVIRPGPTFPGVLLLVNESWAEANATEMGKQFIAALDG